MRSWGQTLKLGLGGRDRSMKLEVVIDFVADRTHNLKLRYERKLGNGKVIDEVEGGTEIFLWAEDSRGDLRI